MKNSRRNFIAAGLALPAAGLARVTTPSRIEPAVSLAQGSGGLRYRTIGKTGMKVTSVAFGCMITSDASVVEKAADLGINYFDTARGYQGGNNERMVGSVLKSRRKNVYISTKTGARTKEAALADLDTSLATLGTDYVDIWYLHGKTSADQLTPDLLEAQQIAKKAGKARFVGFSTHGGYDNVIPAAVKLKHFDVILTSYNFTMGSSIDKVLDEAKAAGIGIIAMKVMAGGFRRPRGGGAGQGNSVMQRQGAFISALKWVLRTPRIDAAIPSMTDSDQLEQNLKAMASDFSADDEKILAAQLRYMGSMYCRGCGGCEGQCSKGLPTQDLVRFAMYADGYGQFALGREQYLELPAEMRSVHCSDCSGCTIRCPNGVNVASRVSRAQELFG
ncbi:MAG: aldo/keto reductase [bacterium]|jgi:aryl-alcohol dehydrogenase-like predicted oxidoreductase